MVNISDLPIVRGKYRENAELAKVTWFAVGGVADVLYKPADEQDLVDFLQQKPTDVPVFVLGVGSNVLIRDGGFRGVVVRLGRYFCDVDIEGDVIKVGAGCLNSNLSAQLANSGVAGLEFLSGIPGTVGGACAMNAGAYGTELSDVFVECRAVDGAGKVHVLSGDEMQFSYRHNGVPKDYIFTQATLRGEASTSEKVTQRMNEIKNAREESQPIREKTGGSTFANPDGEKKAWQLVDEVDGRGLMIGGAQVSEKHCNFLINTGNATAEDLEMLGEELRARIKDKFAIDLRWEIQRIGQTN